MPPALDPATLPATVTVECTECHHLLMVKSSAIGKKARCPQCKAVFPVSWKPPEEPAAPPVPVVDPALIDSLASMKESAPTPGVFEIGQDDPEEDPEDGLAALAATSDAPVKKKKKPKPAEPEPPAAPAPTPALPAAVSGEAKSSRPVAPVAKTPSAPLPPAPGRPPNLNSSAILAASDIAGSGLAARARARADLPENLKPKPVVKPSAPTLPIVCFGCGQRLRVSITHVGKKVKCPRCAAFITVVDPDVEKELEKEVLSAYRPTLSEKIDDPIEESVIDDLLPPANPATRPVEAVKPPPSPELSRPAGAFKTGVDDFGTSRTTPRPPTKSTVPNAAGASGGPRPIAPARPNAPGSRTTTPPPPTGTTRFETTASTSAGGPAVPLFIAFHCTGCGQKLKIKAAAVGKSLACPKCKTMVTVPDLPPRP